MRAALALPAFRRLAATYALNELADWLATIALAVLVFDRTGDALATTALFVATKFLPSLLVPGLAARVERFPVARCLAVLYVAEAAALGALALSASAFSLALVCGLAFVDGTLAATARAVTRSATVAVLEPVGRLREGNGLLNLGFAAMNVAGPAATGFLVAGLGVGWVLGLAGFAFAGLAALVGSARGMPGGTTDEAPWTVRLRAGAAYVARHPVIGLLVAAEALLLGLLSMATPIEVIYAKETLGAGDVGFGSC